MAERGTPTIAPPAAGNGSRVPSPARPLRRRRSLPGSRAVVGGLLVTASAVGLFAAYGSANEGPDATFVVAAHAIAKGDVITAADLEVLPIELTGLQRRWSYSDPRNLVGSVASVSIEEGQLFQQGLVTTARRGSELAKISIAVEPGNAMNGEGLEGQPVDVIVTITEGADALTDTVAEGVTVAKVISGDDNLGSTGELIVVLNVDPDELEIIAEAAARGTITLARTSSR